MHLALRRRRTGIHHLAVRATRRMPSPSPGCLRKARAGGHRAVGNEWERLASAGAARNSPPVTGGSKYLVWTFAVPGVDPRRTRGAISAGPGRARPTHVARERCPASAPWRGRRLDRHREDVAIYRERVRRPRAGRFPASPLSQPASACVAAGGKAAGRVPGLGPGTVSRTGRALPGIQDLVVSRSVG
jgi:hypothetical protein